MSNGGRVLDASFVAARARGSLAADAWLATARALTMPLYLPSLALLEVRAVRPHAAAVLAELLEHPSVLHVELDASTATAVDQLLTDAGVFDALAGHVAHVASRRGWPVLSADPDRVRRVDPTVAVTQL